MIIKVQSKAVRIWLFFGLIMVAVQIFLGGITRLTGSGLSITKWEIVTGSIIPLTEDAWNESFNLYKETPQYKKINNGISISEFKYIYWWEYLHRLWARIMGFVFIFPFFLFIRKGILHRWLVKDLLLIVFLAVIVASLGWIMVASGLINRPWVNAYKLSFHLCAASILVGYLLWTNLKAVYGFSYDQYKRNYSIYYGLIPILFFLQIFLGGLMSGMKAALVAPTWPDINGVIIPGEVRAISDFTSFIFRDYESNPGSSIIVQFFHRSFAYSILFFVGCVICIQKLKKGTVDKNILWLFLFTLLQGVIGILTLVYSQGSVPLWFGVLHQMLGIFCFSFSIYCWYNVRFRE
ncbi:MAG: COX15/CtaA family protein [Saprospiraceae bacterium]|nr:COX15/CtaA family protein [Candidatus Vicinibacter affinis]